MTIVTNRYIKKPLYVDAVRVTAENFVEISRWCQGDIRTNAENLVVEADLEDPRIPNSCYIYVRVHNPKNPRQTKAFVGDWLLYTARGYKVYTDKAFQGSFDPVVREVTEADTGI